MNTWSLNQWVDYIQSLHLRSMDLSVDRIQQVWAKLAIQQPPLVIAVAGTNGKGTTVSTLESIYRHAGYRTAAYTSPHLCRFNERISINGSPVNDDELLDAFCEIERIRGDITLTFFEFTTLAAFYVFNVQKAQVWCLEVGLGGRFDATSIVHNHCSIITSIGLDHTDWLGVTLEQIGFEKAGIISKGSPVVLASTNMPKSIYTHAKSIDSAVYSLNNAYHLKQNLGINCLHHEALDAESFEFTSPLNGAHQAKNTAGALMAVELMQHRCPVPRQTLQVSLDNIHLKGRLEIIAADPTVLIDVSHNQDSIQALNTWLLMNKHKYQRVYALYGALADKDCLSALAQLNQSVDQWTVCSTVGERGQTGEFLATQLQGQIPGFNTNSVEDPAAAYQQIKASLADHDLLLIFGSFRVVGAIISSI